MAALSLKSFMGGKKSSYSPATEDFISCEHENKGLKIIGKYHGYVGRNREQLANYFFKPSLALSSNMLNDYVIQNVILEIPQKVKHAVTVESRNSTPRYIYPQ